MIVYARALSLLVSAIVAVLPISTARAEYPERMIRLIVPYPPGSGTDTLARYTARRLERELKQTVIVENKTGGNAVIAAQAVITSPPDGYTLLWAANGPVTTNVALYEKLSYDPLVDLVPLARVAYSPMGLFVPARSPYKTADQLFAAIKAKPGALNYGSGSATYSIATEWLLSVVGGKANAIPYKGAAQAITDLIGGQVDFAISELSAALPAVGSEGLRILAVTSERRMPNLPEVPTIQEIGYPDYFQVAWWGVFAPKGTPTATSELLERLLLKIYGDDETKEYLNKNNFSAFVANASDLRKFQEAEILRETMLVKQFNIPRL